MVVRVLKIAVRIIMPAVLVWRLVASAETMSSPKVPRARVTVGAQEFEVGRDGQLRMLPPSLWEPWDDQNRTVVQEGDTIEGL
jgi:hypothetical protein